MSVMGLSSEKVSKIIRGDEHTMATFVLNVARGEELIGRYSLGSHRRLTQFNVSQEKSSLKPYPWIETELWALGITGPVEAIFHKPNLHPLSPLCPYQ